MTAPTNLLESEAMRPLVNACLDRLEQRQPFCYLDFPPELGMTESVFTAIMEEIAVQLNTGQRSRIH